MTNQELPSSELSLYEFAQYCFGALDAVAPERGVELRETMENESVRLDILPDTFGLLFQVGPDDGHTYEVIETSPVACYLLWVVALDSLASMAAIFASEGWKMPDGSVIDAVAAEAARERAAAALAWTENAITSGDMSGDPPRLPRRRPPNPLPPGADKDIELLATELALCGAGWIMHHELAHARLHHRGSGLDPLVKESEADRAATDWLLQSATGVPAKKRSLGIAVATISLLRLENRTGRVTNATGRFDHPPAIERLHSALSDSRVDDDAVNVACVTLCRLLAQRKVEPAATMKLDGPARDLLDELCLAYKRATRDLQTR